MTYWLNGEYHENQYRISIADRGLLLGDGVFETILVRGGVCAFFDEHLGRLQRGLSALQISADMPEGFEDIIGTLVRREDIEGDASVRITVTRGPSSGRGLAFPETEECRASVLVTTSALLRATAPEIMRLKISQYGRSENSVAARHKTLNYLDNVLARHEAVADGADEALMLNGHGRLACASSANVFVIDAEGCVLTPPEEEGALPGVVRNQLLKAGGDAVETIRVEPIAVSALQNGCVFLTNSLIGLRPALAPGQAEPLSPSSMRILQDLQTWYETRLRDNLAMKARSQ